MSKGLLDLELVEPPVAELVSLEELRAHLRLDGITDHDARILGYRRGAVGHLDGYAGILGRALAEQTWTLHLDGFPTGVIQLPLPPLIAVESITYLSAADGAATTLAAPLYQVLAGERAQVRPAYGQAWPSTRCTPRTVSITFTCGWTAPAADEPWPDKLQPAIDAIKLLVEDRFAGPDADRQAAVTRVLRPLKLPRV